MEEGLRAPGIAAVLGEISALDDTASRRLQLAAEAGGGAGLVLRRGSPDPAPNAALTRWHAGPAGVGAGLRLDLWRAKGAAPGSWTVAWDERTLAFALAPGVADRAGGGRRAAAG